MENNDYTQILYKDENSSDGEVDVKEIFAKVYAALKEKGYNPINQVVQYIMSGEPLFITSHGGARALITKVERDELVEELVRFYMTHSFE